MKPFNTMLIVFPIGLRATAADVDIVGLQLDGVQIDLRNGGTQLVVTVVPTWAITVLLSRHYGSDIYSLSSRTLG